MAAVAIAAVVHGLSGGPMGVCLGLGALGFGLAFLVWPSLRRGQRGRDARGWWDWAEILIELPVNLVWWLLRLLWRPFRDGGVDL